MSVFEDIKAKLPIDQYIGRYVELKRSGRNFKACCPFHVEDTPSFYVDAIRGTWRCFGACDTSGDLFDFAEKMHGWDLHTALEKFCEELHIDLPKRGQGQQESFTTHYEYMQHFAHSFAKMLSGSEVAQMYLSSRGIDARTIIDYQIGFCPNGAGRSIARHFKMDAAILKTLGLYSESGFEYMTGRLVLPIRDQKGRVCAFAGRTIFRDEPKYLNTADSPIFHKSQTLYNLDRAQYAARKQHNILIVEGYLDVLQSVQADVENVVGQMGSALTEAQFDRIKFVPQIIVATDGDSAGYASAQRSATTGLSRGLDIRIAVMPQGEDPDSLIRKNADDYKQRITHPLLAEDFLIQRITQALPEGASIQERERAGREFVALISRTNNPIQQAWHVQKLALALALPEKPLLDLLRPPTFQAPTFPGITPHSVAAVDEESHLVWTLVERSMEYYNLERIFNAYQIPSLTIHDFRSTAAREGFRLLLEALQQDDEDVLDYVISRFPPDFRPTITPLSIEMLVATAKRIRMNAIDQQIDYGQSGLSALIQQRARLLAIT